MYPTMVNYLQDYTKRRSNVRKAARASSDAGRRTAKRQALRSGAHGDLIYPLEKGMSAEEVRLDDPRI